jgi:hypothetical protein
METYIIERPSALPAAVAPLSAVRVILAADAARLPQVHQVQVQAELVRALESAGSNGTTGFTGKGIQTSKKRMVVRGVPPRGRPV